LEAPPRLYNLRLHGPQATSVSGGVVVILGLVLCYFGYVA